MKVGDVITVTSRIPKYSKYLMRNIGYERVKGNFTIQAIMKDSLIVLEEGKNTRPQLVSKEVWKRISQTKQDWEEDDTTK